MYTTEREVTQQQCQPRRNEKLLWVGNVLSKKKYWIAWIALTHVPFFTQPRHCGISLIRNKSGIGFASFESNKAQTRCTAKAKTQARTIDPRSVG